ncbi:DUF5642 family protein [Nocardia sp. AG03]|uniref:DUF5642 family protein n=1 Tax=Nocardia sp. AG03 TaxID=3025312 RepID=UPI002418873F|nr:DUF5642 family protein [Nocardia sp. AG03]
MRAGLRGALLAATAVVLAACGSDTGAGVDPLAALPPLADFPVGYSMIGAPESFDSALPGVGDRMAFDEERCRKLIEPPAGPGAGESVSSGMGSAVYLVYVVDTEQSVGDFADAVRECEVISASSQRQTLALTRGTAPDVGPDAVGYRYVGTQGVRADGQQLVDTPMVQERLVGQVGDWLVTASVTVLSRTGEAVTEAQIRPESEVLRTVFDRTIEWLGS